MERNPVDALIEFLGQDLNEGFPKKGVVFPGNQVDCYPFLGPLAPTHFGVADPPLVLFAHPGEGDFAADRGRDEILAWPVGVGKPLDGRFFLSNAFLVRREPRRRPK